MIQLRRIRSVPPVLFAALAGYGERELREIGPQIEQVFASSRGIWLGSRGDVPVFLVGVQFETLVTGGKMWFMACGGLFPIRSDFVRAARRALRLSPFPLDIYVEASFQEGCKFARLFNFQQVGPIDRFIQFRREPWQLQQVS
jgi:hypothetical protein